MDKCSFCGLSELEVKKLLRGQDPNALICDSCIGIGYDNLDDEKFTNVQIDINPKSIKRELDKYVIGQEIPKKILSVAIYNHMLKIENNLNIQKGNILLIGPTGSGKTYLSQIMAKILKVPCIIADTTTLTESGYVGSDVETIFQPLINKYSVEEISKSIIVLDEIDKKARKSGPNMSLTRDVSAESVQYSILKMIEGCQVDVPLTGMRKHPHGDKITIDTSNILFIFSGAFVGLSDIIAKRLGKNEVGFGDKIKISKSVKETELLKQIEQDDLIQFGLIPELVGRIPIISTLDELKIDDLCRILTEPKDNLIIQYKTLLNVDNIKIHFSQSTIEKIAKTAYDKKIGARGLKSVIENIMIDFMFDVDRKNSGEYNIEI